MVSVYRHHMYNRCTDTMPTLVYLLWGHITLALWQHGMYSDRWIGYPGTVLTQHTRLLCGHGKQAHCRRVDTPMSYCGLIWYTFHIWYSLPLSCIPGTHFHHLAHILVTLLSHTHIALHTHPVNQHNKHSCHRAHLLLTPITAYIQPTFWSPWTHGTCSHYHAQMVHLPNTMHLPPILITIPPYVTVHPLAPTAHQHTMEPFTSLTIS